MGGEVSVSMFSVGGEVSVSMFSVGGEVSVSIFSVGGGKVSVSIFIVRVFWCASVPVRGSVHIRVR